VNGCSRPSRQRDQEPASAHVEDARVGQVRQLRGREMGLSVSARATRTTRSMRSGVRCCSLRVRREPLVQLGDALA
jgi:hypothetical protein